MQVPETQDLGQAVGFGAAVLFAAVFGKPIELFVHLSWQPPTGEVILLILCILPIRCSHSIREPLADLLDNFIY